MPLLKMSVVSTPELKEYFVELKLMVTLFSIPRKSVIPTEMNASLYKISFDWIAGSDG